MTKGSFFGGRKHYMIIPQVWELAVEPSSSVCDLQVIGNNINFGPPTDTGGSHIQDYQVYIFSACPKELKSYIKF